MNCLIENTAKATKQKNLLHLQFHHYHSYFAIVTLILRTWTVKKAASAFPLCRDPPIRSSSRSDRIAFAPLNHSRLKGPHHGSSNPSGKNGKDQPVLY